MNIWAVLGISPTTDITAIKQAYAARAKEWHPEDHPEEFRELRNAYRIAVAYAKSGGTKNGEAEKQFVQWEAMTQQQTAHETPSQSEEREAEPQKPQHAEQEPRFSYDDVSSFYQKELAERFFREFRWIVRNPYLQNKKSLWSYFLFQIDYDDLYYHDGFRQKLLREICAVSGWHRETLDYFEWWLSLYRETSRQEIGGKKRQRNDSWKETDSRKWRWKKRWSSLPHMMPEHMVSQELRQKHYSILQTMRDRGLDNSLLNAPSAESYFKYYRSFITDNEKWLEDQYKIGCRKRGRYRIMTGLFLALVTAILLLELVINPMRAAKKKEALREQKALEESIRLEEQERLEQEAWQRELDERFQTMQEQYEEWMEQGQQ